MLILTRRIQETMVIGDDVLITVLGVKGNQVRLGINAPKDVSVHREEIFLKIKAEQDALNMGGCELDACLTDAFRAHQQTPDISHVRVNH